jgi:transposase-like protein
MAPAGGHPPVTDDDRRRIAELHAQGNSRNAIAEAIGRSGRTVSRICAEHDPPLTFERTRTAAATEAKKADGAARRAQLQLDALAAAQKHLGQYFAETTVFNFGGKENDYNERTLPEPPHRDKRDIASAVSSLVAAALKLAEYDKATGNDGEKGMLGELFDELRAARDQHRTGQP